MSATVCLNDIVDALELELQFDLYLSFVNLDTGEVETVSREVLGWAEEGDDEEEDGEDLEGEDGEWEICKRIASSDRFERLPTNFDIHEWAIMEEFSDSVGSERLREDLLQALHGSGAFRNFKWQIRRAGIEKSWFAFRKHALREIAIKWCAEHRIAWRGGSGRSGG